MQYISAIAFLVCSGIGIFSLVMYGFTPWLILYAVCAAVNIPGALKIL